MARVSTTFSFCVTSRGGDEMRLAVVASPRWTCALLRISYLLLRITRDRHGEGLVARACRLHDRHSEKFPLDGLTTAQINEFRCWRRRMQHGGRRKG
jgi:hypothetical protein